MRVRLLNDGLYPVMEHLKFPIDVDGWYFSDDDKGRRLVIVSAPELARVGAMWDVNGTPLSFRVGTECEVIE